MHAGGCHQTSNISRTLEGNKTVNHSVVVGASPVGAGTTAGGWGWWCGLSFAIWRVLCLGFGGKWSFFFCNRAVLPYARETVKLSWNKKSVHKSWVAIYTPLPFTAHSRYIAVFFLQKNSEKTPLNSHVSGRYGVSFVSSSSQQRFRFLSYLLCSLSCCRRPRYVEII